MSILKPVTTYLDVQYEASIVRPFYSSSSKSLEEENDGSDDDSSMSSSECFLHTFLTASAKLKGPNEIRVLVYNEDSGQISCIGRYEQENEVLEIKCAPNKKHQALVATSSPDGSSSIVHWYSIPHEMLQSDGHEIQLTELDGFRLWKQEGRIVSLDWNTTGKIISVSDRSAHIYQLSKQNDDVTLLHSQSIKPPNQFTWGGWDPHDDDRVALTHGNITSILDTRETFDVNTASQAICQSSIDVSGITPLALGGSWNPNKPDTMAIAYDDGMVRIWNLRNLKNPVKVLRFHQHWCTQVAYNPFHDQLVLSGSVDTSAILWRASSVSSATLIEMEDETDNTEVADTVVGATARYDRGEVDSMCWSATDAWVWAQARKTGEVEIYHVPQAEKYKILL